MLECHDTRRKHTNYISAIQFHFQQRKEGSFLPFSLFFLTRQGFFFRSGSGRGTERITCWTLCAKCMTWRSSAPWADSLSKLRTNWSSVATLFMYNVASFIEPCFIYKITNSSLTMVAVSHGERCIAVQSKVRIQLTLIFFFSFLTLQTIFTVWTVTKGQIQHI